MLSKKEWMDLTMQGIQEDDLAFGRSLVEREVAQDVSFREFAVAMLISYTGALYTGQIDIFCAGLQKLNDILKDSFLSNVQKSQNKEFPKPSE